ncbi:MAG: bacillithiol system redox-active protein YtxJ [Ferruginibacter sp.]
MINWINLSEISQLDTIQEKSLTTPQIIFKHSTRCSISSMAKSRLERGTPPDTIDFYYLDLISYRNVSNAIAEKFQVFHESPQILLIKNGACTYDESHTGISLEEILEQA